MKACRRKYQADPSTPTWDSQVVTLKATTPIISQYRYAEICCKALRTGRLAIGIPSHIGRTYGSGWRSNEAAGLTTPRVFSGRPLDGCNGTRVGEQSGHAALPFASWPNTI